MEQFVYKCEGIHHSGRNCGNGCVAIVTTKGYPPKNCLIFTEGYKLTKPKWIKVDQGENNVQI